MLKLKYHQGERRDLYHIMSDDEAKCGHCSAVFEKNSKNIKNYDGHGYLCEDCKLLVCESIRKRGYKMKTVLRLAKEENIQLFIDNNLDITEDIGAVLRKAEPELLRLFIDNNLKVTPDMEYILMWSKKENLEFFIKNKIAITRDKWYLLEEASLGELRKALRQGEIKCMQ